MSLLSTIDFIASHPLNEGNKSRALFRFVKWQIGSRLVPGTIVYEWINGSRFLVRTGDTGLTGNIYAGLHEFSEMAFLLHFLRADDLFIDVGANVGSYTILACSAVGAKGYAFEPVPSTYNRLLENMRLNHLDEKVKCVNKAVGAEQGLIAFTGNSDTTNHVLAIGEYCDSKVMVEVTTLDKALQGEQPTLIKIDVEGYETLVLEGAQNVLQSPALKAVIMELNGSGVRYAFDESKALALMLSHGFRTYEYNPFERTLIHLQGKNLASGNTLFIRDEAFVKDQLRTSAKVVVQGRHL